ncbi:RNA polymerase sigma24 factor [Rhizocola hellebori]|uniref:RNA polymerase sigma24 factor n=1 Tax=Rhizocola hellebori TaxID=1392758 RepID=A0A8J3Q2D0_9ACTN|nr:SigE family RNA polymerase sigma factor [Rhizocola hellebori]GIH02183.1 RNA polymerase sigma24 factor [Rhizocola hellebori]
MTGIEHRREFANYFAARRDTVRRTAYLLCGDWHWADDLTQITFVRLADAWSRVRQPAALDAFTRTCLVRVYLAESRRLFRRRERASAVLPEVGQADHADRINTRLEVIEAMATLPPRQRATLVCRFYQGLSVQETAEVLDCSIGTIKSQTSRGLAALRRLLGTALDDPSLDEVRR